MPSNITVNALSAETDRSPHFLVREVENQLEIPGGTRIRLGARSISNKKYLGSRLNRLDNCSGDVDASRRDNASWAAGEPNECSLRLC